MSNYVFGSSVIINSRVCLLKCPWSGHWNTVLNGHCELSAYIPSLNLILTLHSYLCFVYDDLLEYMANLMIIGTQIQRMIFKVCYFSFKYLIAFIYKWFYFVCFHHMPSLCHRQMYQATYLTHQSNILEFPAYFLLWNRHDDVIKWKHFPRYWPVTRSFDVFFDLRLKKTVEDPIETPVVWNAIALIMMFENMSMQRTIFGWLCFHIVTREANMVVDPLWDHYAILPWGTNTSVADIAELYYRNQGPVLTHWGRDKMADISQTTLSSAFSWMKMLEFRLKFHWSLFLRSINNIPALVQIMAWRRSGDKP